MSGAKKNFPLSSTFFFSFERESGKFSVLNQSVKLNVNCVGVTLFMQNINFILPLPRFFSNTLINQNQLRGVLMMFSFHTVSRFCFLAK